MSIMVDSVLARAAWYQIGKNWFLWQGNLYARGLFLDIDIAGEFYSIVLFSVYVHRNAK